MPYGLREEVIEKVKSIFAKVQPIEKVVLYGSRAKETYQNGSDIDICLYGRNLTLQNAVYPLMEFLDELYLPYSFDISIFDHIDNPALIEHITHVGIVLYIRT